MSMLVSTQMLKNLLLMIGAMIVTLFVCIGFDLANGLSFAGDYHTYYWSDVFQYVSRF